MADGKDSLQETDSGAIYLNVAEWGEGLFGVEAASLHYFGKPALLLGPEEAARLAAVLPNPRRYKANGSSRFVQKRTRLIYHIMVEEASWSRNTRKQPVSRKRSCRRRRGMIRRRRGPVRHRAGRDSMGGQKVDRCSLLMKLPPDLGVQLARQE